MPSNSNIVENAELVIERFGRWVEFHDSEVTSLQLARENRSMLVDLKVPSGYVAGVPTCMVRLAFADIEDLELSNFNEQNVLWSIAFEPQDQGMEVTLHASYGLGGRFRCQAARVVSVQDA